MFKRNYVLLSVAVSMIFMLTAYIWFIRNAYFLQKGLLVKSLNTALAYSIRTFNAFEYNEAAFTAYSNDSILNFSGLGLSSESPSLLKNGDFEEGDTAFSSLYMPIIYRYDNLASNVRGLRWVINDPHSFHGTWYGRGFGGKGFFLLLAGSGYPHQFFWSQRVPVKKNTAYLFSFYLSSVAIGDTLITPYNNWMRACVSASINGKRICTDMAPRETEIWKEVIGVYYSGEDSLADIKLYDYNTASYYNNFAIDALKLRELGPSRSFTVPVQQAVSAERREKFTERERYRHTLYYLLNDQLHYDLQKGEEVQFELQLISGKDTGNQLPNERIRGVSYGNEGNKYYELFYEPGHDVIATRSFHLDHDYHASAIISNYRQILFNRISSHLLSIVIITVLALVILLLIHRRQQRDRSVEEQKYMLVNNITHELKTPIATLQVGTDQLIAHEDQFDKVRRHEYYRILHAQSRKLNHLVENALRIYQIENEQLQALKERYSINAILEEVYQEARQIYAEVLQQNKSIQLQISDPDAVMMLDRFHFKNALLALVENAVKYGGEQCSIVLKAEHQKGFSYLSVSDNGPGIDPRYQKLVFDKFFRIPNNDRHQVKGYGLGLCYVKMVMDMHQASIGIISDGKTGCSFKIKCKHA